MKTITVKGIGSVSARPDFVVISMELETVCPQYEAAMEQAAEKIEELNAALEKVGFEKEAVKTTGFRIDTVYESIRSKDGNYNSKLVGYRADHSLKVSFDFDSARLGAVLCAITNCSASPELTIHFTVKDPSAVNAAMLRSAAANARRKAEILCEASGRQLGELVSIDYNWGEISIESRTEYNLEKTCCPDAPMRKSIDFEPDDIRLNDTATFVWEIESLG